MPDVPRLLVSLSAVFLDWTWVAWLLLSGIVKILEQCVYPLDLFWFVPWARKGTVSIIVATVELVP